MIPRGRITALSRASHVPRETMERAADPYYVVRDELRRRVDELREKVTRTGGASGSWRTEDLLAECESALWELDELDRAIATASADRERFGISESELEERRRWGGRTRERVREAAAALESRRARERASGGGRRDLDLDRGRSVGSDASESGFDDHQQLLVRRQDEDLDDISASISRIGQVGLTIGEELASQSKMLEDLEEDVDGVNARLAAAEKKMREVLQKVGLRGQLCVIVFLTVILFILFYVAFS